MVQKGPRSCELTSVVSGTRYNAIRLSYLIDLISGRMMAHDLGHRIPVARSHLVASMSCSFEYFVLVWFSQEEYKNKINSSF